MIHVEILGEDSPQTRVMTEAAWSAVQRMGIDATVVQVSDRQILAQYPNVCGAGICVDGVVVSTGPHVRPEDIENLLRWRHPGLCG